MESRLTFTHDKKTQTICINPENTFLKLTKLIVRPKNLTQNTIFHNPINIKYTIRKINQTYETNSIFEMSNHSFRNYNETVILDKIISESPLNKNIEICFDFDENYICEADLYFTSFDIKVDLKNPIQDFKQHLEVYDNTKILFSGPFGQGKTTFLNYFFDKEKDKYEVFKLYPVNYAVSHNEDIFKYIKAELLFQLMGKDVDFDKIDFNYSDAAYSYFSQNIDKIISPLLSLIPKIGETAANVFDKIHELHKAVKDHESKLQVDDKKAALHYIKNLYEKEGSIFEDNFYTQLIRQLLEQHKQKHNKQNVLIIDDIDRMDPDHIFRIFNVFSANFDSLEYLNGLPNKFGFDKIILVCDYLNIKKLFIHRYGNSVAFDGYLSKYYSRQPFEYDNKQAILVITKSLTSYKNQPVSSVITNALELIINDLIYTNEIALRDLLKLTKHDFYSTIDRQSRIYSNSLKKHRHHFLFFNIIAFLEHLFDRDSIIEKFRRCKTKAPYRNKVNYKYYTQIGMVVLATELQDDTSHLINFKNDSFSFKINQKSDSPLNYDYYEAIDVQRNFKIENFTFDVRDFYEMLLLNTERYMEA